MNLQKKVFGKCRGKQIQMKSNSLMRPNVKQLTVAFEAKFRLHLYVILISFLLYIHLNVQLSLGISMCYQWFS